MSERFDAIVIGTGQAGPSLAVRLAQGGPQDRDHRAQALRRHLRQQRLHSDEDADRERARRARRAHARRRGASSCRRACASTCAAVKARKDDVVRQSQRQASPSGSGTRRASPSSRRMRASKAPHAVRVGDAAARSAADLRQRRRPRERAADHRHRRRPVSRQRLDDGRRLRCRAHLVDRRRQLRRARVRADVPPLRQRGDRRRDGRAPDRAARTRRCPAAIKEILEAEGITIRLGREVRCGPPRTATRIAVGVECDERAARDRRLASAARDRPTAEHRRPGLRARRASRSTQRGYIVVDDAAADERRRASGRSAMSTAAARSRTRRTTTTRSSPRTCSTARRGASATAFPPTRCSSIRRSARAGMTEREARAHGPQRRWPRRCR